jgi:hypothetical protein
MIALQKKLTGEDPLPPINKQGSTKKVKAFVLCHAFMVSCLCDFHILSFFVDILWLNEKIYFIKVLFFI